MPTVDANRLKGNYAAAHVAARLSAVCLVRPVAADTDVGVDLFCETLEGTSPFLHFWVQVKSGAQCRVSADGRAASCYFSSAHLDYWRRQPVPVYAALVPIDWPVTADPDVHIVDITHHLLWSPQGQSGESITAQYKWRAGCREDVKVFLENYVPASAARVLCRNGVVAPTPSVEPRYVQVVPSVPVGRFTDQIITQIRRTAAFAIIYLKNEGALREPHAAFRQRLARIAAQFDDDDHWETHAAQAFSYHADRDFARAVTSYDKAIATIRADEHVRDDPDWVRQVTELQLCQQRAECGEDL